MVHHVSEKKVSDNGFMLYGLDIFRFQISIHRLELDLPKKDSPLRKHQTLAFGYKVEIFLHSRYLFTH